MHETLLRVLLCRSRVQQELQVHRLPQPKRQRFCQNVRRHCQRSSYKDSKTRRRKVGQRLLVPKILLRQKILRVLSGGRALHRRLQMHLMPKQRIDGQQVSPQPPKKIKLITKSQQTQLLTM